MSDFLQMVIHAFKNLLNQGLLSIESSEFDDQSFGNALVVLSGENLRVRLLRDRGDLFSEVASKVEPNNWYPLQRVICVISASSPLEGLLTPVAAAKLVERYFNDLERALGGECFDQTKSRLADLERFAIKRFIDRTKRSGQ